MTLPPLIDIIRGCSEQQYQMLCNVRENNRPQNKGLRNNPYVNIILHHTAGVNMVETIQEQNLILTERISELEEKLSRQREKLDEIIKLFTP